MAYTTPTVNYATTLDGTYTSLTGIQNVTITRGRKRPIDPFQQSSCVIELIPANSYATALAIGQFIDVRPTNSASSRAFFAGKITDVQRFYDFPYDSGTGAAPGDRIVITATGGTGTLGQGYGTYDWVSSEIWLATEQIPWGCAIYSDALGTNKISAQTVTTSPLDIMNRTCNTLQRYIDDVDLKRVVNFGFSSAIYLYQKSNNTVTFSDTGSGYAMKNVEYESSAQNTYSRVRVEPAGLASQTTEAATAPYNTAVLQTYNVTTNDALAVSAYFYNLNSGQLTAVPTKIVTDTTVAESCTDLLLLYKSFGTSPPPEQPYIGADTTVIFRGVTANAVTQGFSATFYPDRAVVTAYLSPGLGVPFTLDSTQFGILDTNRLGWN